jgi:hypothetical protein
MSTDIEESNMAKVLYTQKGTDPTTIIWPSAGPPNERWPLTSGVPTVIFNLIGYGDGSVTYPDGRALPPLSPQGSTVVHQKG